MIESTISSPSLLLRRGPGRRHQIDGLGGVAREDDFLGAPRVQELRDARAAALISFGRGIGEVMQTAVHVSVFALVALGHAVEHRARLLR